MDGSRAQIGIDVLDTYAPVIDYSPVWVLISLVFGNNWEMYHWNISVAFTITVTVMDMCVDDLLVAGNSVSEIKKGREQI